jgi:hypothetical protein
MPRVTFTVDEDVLWKARQRARNMKRSLSALVREYVRELAGEARVDRATAAAELMRFFEAADIVVGPRRGTRDELHDRGPYPAGGHSGAGKTA